MINVRYAILSLGFICFVCICVNDVMRARAAKKVVAPVKTQAELDAMWAEDREEERRFLARPEYVRPQTVYIDNSTNGVSTGDAVAIAVAAALIFRR